MACAGLLFLMLMSSSFLLSTVSFSPNDLDPKTKEKATFYLEYIEKFAKAASPFISLIPVGGSYINKVLSAASIINKEINPEITLQDLIYQFDYLNSKLDQYHVEQKWETWASGAYHKPEMNINVAWKMLNTTLHSAKETKDDNEKAKQMEEFMKNYKNHQGDTKELWTLLIAKGTSFINRLGDLLAEHVNCHEKDIRQYTLLINKLIYKGNTMNQFYYNLKKTESQAKVDEEAQIAYDAASTMFNVHKKCIESSIDYIQKDVLTLIERTKKSSALAKEVWSFLVKEYDKYDWMVVAFKTKKSNTPIKLLNSHVLTGITEVTKEGITVAVARQVKGTHTRTVLVKQTIGRCIKDSVNCHEVAKKLDKCTETMKGTPVTRTYTAVHAYIREAHDSHNEKEETDEDYEVGDQAPAVYIGKCKKYLGLMSGKFVVLIKSDEEIETKDPCSKLNCGGKERGECVKVKDMFRAMCECKPPYYGEHCEESLEDYKKYLKGEMEIAKNQYLEGEKQMVDSSSNYVGSGQ